MYLGSIVEMGPTDALFERPAHPYTAALIAAVPRPQVPASGAPRASVALQGDPPSPLDPPSGCRFHPRCPAATERCRIERPVLVDSAGGRVVACHHALQA
jgi:oligopeptide/dipeptide ABC transporter ATP-binding protein